MDEISDPPEVERGLKGGKESIYIYQFRHRATRVLPQFEAE